MIKGENLDTTKHTGEHRENTPAWVWWTMTHVHVSEMRTLKRAGIIGTEDAWSNVAEHLLVTNAASIFLGSKLASQGIDLSVMETASVLHDVAKRLDKESGISYGDEKNSSVLRNFLEDLDYPSETIEAVLYTGRVSEMFIDDPVERAKIISMKPLEQLVVAYIDARMRNTNIVSLEEARDLNKMKVPADTAIYDKWFTFYKEVEDRIFVAINDPDFTPESINDENVIGMIRKAYIDRDKSDVDKNGGS